MMRSHVKNNPRVRKWFQKQNVKLGIREMDKHTKGLEDLNGRLEKYIIKIKDWESVKRIQANEK